MAISLTRTEISSTLPKVEAGLGKYVWLQAKIAGDGNFHADPTFRRRFNAFYRVRRGSAWREAFYTLMGRAKEWTFAQVLDELSGATGRLEVSFASKLVARRACAVYDALGDIYAEFLCNETGRYLVQEFRGHYPAANVTELKMLDLVLWQTRV